MTETSEKPDAAASWSRYWASGALTSLPEDFHANYDGEIADFWARQVDALSEGAAVLDVCTGNGAIALLVAEQARRAGRRVRVTAIDAAEVHPEVIARRFPGAGELLSSIRFVSRRRLEDLAVAPDSIDLITSQYGIEYCRWAAAAERCHHFLKPGGRLAIVAHALSSDLLSTMRRESDEYERLCQAGLTELLRKRLAGRLDGPSFDSRMRAVHAGLEHAAAGSPTPLLRYAISLAAGSISMSAAAFARRRQTIEQACNQLDDGYNRLSQMLTVNEALAAHPDWTDAFTVAGLDRLDRGSLTYRGQHKAGDWFVFGKPSA